MYRKPDGNEVPINFSVIDFVQMLKDSAPKIFAFISGEEQQALKEAAVTAEE